MTYIRTHLLLRELASKAKGILVFPSIVKAGIGIGGSYGEGALIIGGTKSSVLQ